MQKIIAKIACSSPLPFHHGRLIALFSYDGRSDERTFYERVMSCQATDVALNRFAVIL
jgi:hypothetical protein